MQGIAQSAARALADCACAAYQRTQAQFETAFVDPYTHGKCTVTFWLGEPALYHPPHQAKPAFAHIDSISDGFFVVGQSSTGRTIPFAQAQRVLKVKLSTDDIEREVSGHELDAAERLL